MKRKTRHGFSPGPAPVRGVAAGLSVRERAHAVHAEITSYADIVNSRLALAKGELLLHP
jgi:hypothetical protein